MSFSLFEQMINPFKDQAEGNNNLILQWIQIIVPAVMEEHSNSQKQETLQQNFNSQNEVFILPATTALEMSLH